MIRDLNGDLIFTNSRITTEKLNTYNSSIIAYDKNPEKLIKN